METAEAEVLYEEQQGSEHTHTVGHRGTPAITDANVFTTPIPLLSLIPLNRSFISPPSFSYTALASSLYHLGSPWGAGGSSRQTPLFPTALPRLKLKSLSIAPIVPPPPPPPLAPALRLALLAQEQRDYREEAVAFIDGSRSTEGTRD